MKIDRLIGIITILQQKGKVTAPYLAERFEVSRRTINRDIEAICQAGIPIVTTQGADGGIEIMPGYQLDTTVFTQGELQSILVGLKSLESITKSDQVSQARVLAEKLGGGRNVIPVEEDMLIDLSSFYKDSLAEKIALLREAIRQRRMAGFRYYYAKGEEDKLVEPYLVVFKWSAWYLFGYSRERQDFRLYKLNRLWQLCMLEETFVPRDIPEEKLAFGSHMTDDKVVTAVYGAGEKYRLIEEYGPDCFQVWEDGRLYTEWGFTTYEDAIRWLLPFGDRVQVLGPENFLELFLNEVQKIRSLYENIRES